MEIKLTEKQKTILEGVIRTSVFLTAMRELSLFFMNYITLPMISVVLFLIDSIPDFKIPIIPEEFFELLLAPLIILYLLVVLLFNTYIIAKLCGIFKYFAKFKFWKSFLMLLIISTVLYYFYALNLHTFKLNYNINDNKEFAYTIIPSYLVYLFFNYLTKKFPKPFEKIGYFFSIEFYINLFKKIVNKFKRCK